MKTQFTPGHWYHDGFVVEHATNGECDLYLEVLSGAGGYDYDLAKTNATLIAAAPEMFEALERAEQHLSAMADITTSTYGAETLSVRYSESLQLIRSALAKARGGDDSRQKNDHTPNHDYLHKYGTDAQVLQVAALLNISTAPKVDRADK